MSPFRQARLMSVVLLFVTLAAGILVGVAWSERDRDETATPPDEVEQAARTPAADDPDDPGQDRDRERRPPVIFELDLDPEQRARLEGMGELFTREWEALDEEMHQEMRRRQRELRRAAWDSTRAVLRPDQLARYDSLLTARYARRDSIRGGGGRGNDSDRGRRPDDQNNNRRPFSPEHWKDHR